jgi:hypothetical protein
MMTSRSGISGDLPWPENKRFKSTIDFDVIVPNNAANDNGTATSDILINCKYAWENGTLPENAFVDCTGIPSDLDDTVFFSMQPYTKLGRRRPELSFELWVIRQTDNHK